MTLTTRTTRKAPWAVVMTVLLAVFAMVGAMTLVGVTPASATKNIKVTICHATASHDNPYVQEKVSGSSIDEVQNKLWNGHGDHTGPVFPATNEDGKWGDIIPAFGDFPGINTGASVADCAGTVEETFDAEHAYCAVTEGSALAPATKTVTGFKSQADADAAMVKALEGMEEGIIPPFYGVEDIHFDGFGWTTEGQALFANGCVPKTEPTLYAGTATYPTVKVCYGPDVIEVGPIATPFGTEKTYTSQAEADAVAAGVVKANLEGATVGFMAAHPEYAPVPADGICIPTTEPEPVTVVEPATVAVPAPATVPIPAKVTLPATIPAGEGPTVPAYVLALLVLGATALAASTVRLVRTTR